MEKEIEIKIFDINPEKIENKLRFLGAEKQFDKIFKLYSYQLDDESTNLPEHIRLRDEGDKITLAYKKKTDFKAQGTQEIEFVVSSFEKAKQFLKVFEDKFNGIFYQEKRRIQYKLNDIEFMIDFWPKIKPFLEIEAKSEEKLREGLELLNLENQELNNPCIVQIYEKEGLDLHSFKELKFE